MSIGLYDGDLQKYFHCPFNLELMKIAAYYKNKNQIVSLSPTFSPERYSQFFYRKDYYDGTFPEKLMTSKNVEYGGLAFTQGTYAPMDLTIETTPPDRSIYEKVLKTYFDFKGQEGLRKSYAALTNSQHLRLSLDGKTVWSEFEKQLKDIDSTSAFFFHDTDLGKIENSYEVIQDILKLRKDTILPQRVGMKFNTTINTDDDLIKWSSLYNLNNFFALEFQGLIGDEALSEVVDNIPNSRSKQIEYNITKNLSSQDDFFLKRLPKIYHQLLFCRDNRRFFSLKYDDNFFVDKRWERVIDLLNCYIRSAARSNLQNWTKYNSEDSLFKFCSSFDNHKYLKENFTKEEAKDLFVFVANNNYDLFKEFYETRQIKLKGGSFQYD
jgi:hypothetical protein